MPEISRFYGIVVFMNFNDHLPPHFHVRYSGYKASISIEDGIVTGSFPKRALKLVFEWHELHKTKLKANWEKIENQKPLDKIEPLK